MKAFGSRRAQRHVAPDDGGIITDGLSVWWKLDEGSGTAFYDSMRPAAEGSRVGAVWVPGNFGNALYFDGNNDSAYLSQDTFNPGTGNFSLTAWIRTSKDYSPEPGTIYSDYGVSRNSFIGLYVGTDNKLLAQCRDEEQDQIEFKETGPTVNDGTWRHAAIVRTSATTIAVYLDGALIGTATNAATSDIDISGQYTPVIGRLAHWNANEFQGTIDDIRIYDRALTGGEVSEIAAGTG